eukprot:TRINITY_DN10145_c0_g2_i1.p2 TRINITY_DN10145_c0_g2~~TRINITY_DN10145_c0_g2_i1.p2  ORF type:complete len:163 (-),score=31.57 TRINITY_DN10145_c0_g2_i1:111-599(-)
MGSIPSFHAARLYDPSDAEAPALNGTIAKWNSFYKQWRAPRPSGSAGLLLADLVHILRPDSRSLEAVVHCTTDTSTPARALASFANPSQVPLNLTITVPLYYTGLTPGSAVSVQPATVTADAVLFDGPKITHVLGEAGGGFTDIRVPVSLPTSSYGLSLIHI